MLTLAAATLVAGASVPGLRVNWLTKTLSWSPLVHLGVRSYGVYLFNTPCIIFVARLGGWTPGVRLLGAVASLVVAALCFRFVEKPALRLKDRVEAKRHARRIPDGAYAGNSVNR
jgi:peptidoglycan/LPS O-acetylase OafA/YrhL